MDTFARLMELNSAIKDWPAVSQNAGRYLAVNPLVALPYRHLAQASEALEQRDTAIRACKTLLLLDPDRAQGRRARLGHA